MRIGLDCTPLLGRRSGIGTYTLHLLEALVDRYPHDEFAATAFTWNGRRELAEAVPPGVTVASRPVRLPCDQLPHAARRPGGRGRHHP